WLAHRPAAFQLLHENVEPARGSFRAHCRLHEAERVAVLAQPEVGALRIGEEITQRELARRRLHRGDRRGRAGAYERGYGKGSEGSEHGDSRNRKVPILTSGGIQA